MIFPHKITGSLWPTFVPVRFVNLSVRQTYAITLLFLLFYKLSLPYARLRYFLAGDHPSQTTHHTLSFL